MYLANGDLGLTELTARRAVEIAQQLVAADAENTQARVILAADFANLADVESRSRHQDAAREAFTRALAVDRSWLANTRLVRSSGTFIINVW